MLHFIFSVAATLSDGSVHGVQNGKIQKRPSGHNKIKNKNKRFRWQALSVNNRVHSLCVILHENPSPNYGISMIRHEPWKKPTQFLLSSQFSFYRVDSHHLYDIEIVFHFGIDPNLRRRIFAPFLSVRKVRFIRSVINSLFRLTSSLFWYYSFADEYILRWQMNTKTVRQWSRQKAKNCDWNKLYSEDRRWKWGSATIDTLSWTRSPWRGHRDLRPAAGLPSRIT